MVVHRLYKIFLKIVFYNLTVVSPTNGSQAERNDDDAIDSSAENEEGYTKIGKDG